MNENNYIITQKDIDKEKNYNFIDLSFNFIDNINIDIKDNNVIKIILNHNYLVKLIKIIDYFPNLVVIDISNNIINTLFDFGCFKFLTDINISNNKIKNIIKLSENNSLKKVNLSYNQISNIDNLVLLKNLEILLWKNNLINSLEVINNFNNLVLFDLSFNKINKLKKLKNLNLNEVILNNNQISEFFQISKNLKIINLNNNNIKKINKLENIEELYLNNNKIDNINNLKYLQQTLVYIDISYNNISSLIDLNKFKKLNYCDISKNKIKIFEDFFLPNSLKILKLNNNKIKKFCIKNLCLLEKLELDYNYLDNFKNIKGDNLNILSLNNNRLTDFEFLNNLKQLKSLELKFNYIYDIPNFEKNLLIEKIELQNNQIEWFKSFENLKYLNYLNIKNNNKIVEIKNILFLWDLKKFYYSKNTIAQNILKILNIFFYNHDIPKDINVLYILNYVYFENINYTNLFIFIFYCILYKQFDNRFYKFILNIYKNNIKLIDINKFYEFFYNEYFLNGDNIKNSFKINFFSLILKLNIKELYYKIKQFLNIDDIINIFNITNLNEILNYKEILIIYIEKLNNINYKILNSDNINLKIFKKEFEKISLSNIIINFYWINTEFKEKKFKTSFILYLMFNSNSTYNTVISIIKKWNYKLFFSYIFPLIDEIKKHLIKIKNLDNSFNVGVINFEKLIFIKILDYIRYLINKEFLFINILKKINKLGVTLYLKKYIKLVNLSNKNKKFKNFLNLSCSYFENINDFYQHKNCIICFLEIKNDINICLGCLSNIHLDCLENWISIKNMKICPFCKLN